MIKVAVTLILILGFSGCTGLQNQGPGGKGAKVLSVPFFPQEENQCGPVSLAEVYNFWGVRITPERIAEDIFAASVNGTLDMDMLLYPRRSGFRTLTYRGGMEDIRNRIDNGYPLIVLVDLGFSIVQKNHFMVIVGYNNNGIYAHSGRERGKFFPYAELERIWKRTGYWTLLIQP